METKPILSLIGAELVFTGTRSGMTPEQRTGVVQFLNRMRPCIVGHGAAEGADTEFDGIVRAMKLCRIVTFPAGRDPLRHNRLMIDRLGDMVLATPRLQQEEQRSGTWAAIRYARNSKVPVYVIWPDGTAEWLKAVKRA